MASDDAFAGRIYAKVFADTLGYITVGRAMEAVTADAVFFIHLVGQGIHIGIVGHRLMEGCVEYAHLGNRRQKGRYGIYAFQVGGIM